ncbi:MAG: MXAN_6577-like cysteine-rich protein [Nannocystaceae bacterium]
MRSPSPRLRDLAVHALVFLAAACTGGDEETSTESGTLSATTSAATTASTSTGEATETSSTGGGSSGESDAGTGDACPPPLLACGDACVDAQHDPSHCGGCDDACAPGLACLEGQCGVACGEGVAACGDLCTDLDVDPAHCGSCEHACADGVACVDGSCVPACADAELLCGESCVDPTRDAAHCGACDAACAGEQPCVYGLCVDTAIHYVLIGGQSLSLGHGSAVVSTEQPYDNLMLNTGVRAGTNNLTSFVPLVETQQGQVGETIASGLANLTAELELAEGRPHVLAASAHGISGTPYVNLKKGTASFTAGMTQVAAAAQIAADEGKPFAVRAVTIIHGESDHLGGNLLYADNLLEWQADYEHDVTAITEQVHPVAMFLCQMSSWTRYNSATSPIPYAQLAAADARPDRIYVVGPKYFLPYVDGVHLSGDGERWLGEHYAKAYRKVLIAGEPWVPLRPRALSRDGAVITVDFDVPAPPLVLDTELVSDPGNFGFEFWDSSGAPPAVVGVELSGDTQVTITLAAPPAAGNQRLRYAFTGTPGQNGGPQTGPRGNLRDSDPTPSRHDYPLYNWAVHFDEPVD